MCISGMKTIGCVYYTLLCVHGLLLINIIYIITHMIQSHLMTPQLVGFAPSWGVKFSVEIAC